MRLNLPLVVAGIDNGDDVAIFVVIVIVGGGTDNANDIICVERDKQSERG